MDYPQADSDRFDNGSPEGAFLSSPGHRPGSGRGHRGSPERACYEVTLVVTPFQGSGIWIRRVPRALPWAKLGCPVGGILRLMGMHGFRKEEDIRRFVMRARSLIYSLLFFSLSCTTQPDEGKNATPTIALTEVTEEAGLGDFVHATGAVGDKWYPEPMGSGGGFIDYDGDGWLDILVAGGGNWEADPADQPQALWLYRNQGDGTFSEVTEEAGLADVVAYTIGINVADYDNDGDEDFFLTNLLTNMLFRNDGGVFVEVGEEAGLTEESVWSSSSMFFDANKDGILDLYVGNYVEWSPATDIFCPPGGVEKLYCIPAAYTGIPSRFFFGNGDGTFREATESAGFAGALGKSLGVSELDFNNDGWSDLVVVNDGEGDLLYRNNQDGTFSEIGVRSGMAFSEHGEARAGMGVDAGVVDSSGMPSIVVGNFSEEMVGVYRYIGNDSFLDRSASSRIGYHSLMILTFGLILFDIDMDTDLDLLLGNGHVYPDRAAQDDRISYRQPSQVYLNRGDGVFDLFEPEAGPLKQEMVVRGVALGDYDRDGDPDVLLTENGGPIHLWRNDIQNASFLRVRVEGVNGNPDGIGTQIEAVVDGLTIYRRVRTGSSYLSSSERTVTLGLGDHTSVDTLRISWPSGQTVEFTDVAAGQELFVKEGEGGYERINLPGVAQ